MFFWGVGLFFQNVGPGKKKLHGKTMFSPTDSMGCPSRLILGCNELMIIRFMVETVLKGHLPCR